MTTIETCLFVGLAVLGVVQIIFGIGLDRLADRVEQLETEREWDHEAYRHRIRSRTGT